MTKTNDWYGKPYYSLDAYFKNIYGEKCYKIALDAGMSCPNRDGTIGVGGCIFCSAGGSGDFAIPTTQKDISTQIKEGLSLFHTKNVGNRYIAYFQAYTNTYASVEKLRSIYMQALNCPDICGISIATRPDCFSSEIYSLLKELKDLYPKKLIWIELGLQTIHEITASFIRRGYPLSCFERCTMALKKAGIPCIVHVILGLPGETPAMIYETIAYLNKIAPFGIKLQLLHVLKNTDLAALYQQNAFQIYSLEEYLDILIHCLELLSPDIVIHRVTGDGPKDLLIAPLWSLNKRNVLNSLHATMKQRNAYQGRCFYESGSINTL